MPNYLSRGITEVFRNPKFTFSKISAYSAFLLKITKNIPKPTSLQIEPTSKCNLCCKMCAVKKDKSTYAPLSKTNFNKIIKNSLPIESVNLSGLGEPFLNPNYEYFLSQLSKNKVKTFTISNIQLLNEKKVKSIFDSGISSILISLESVDPKTYEAIRAKAKFSVLIKNLELISKYKTTHPQLQIFLNVLLINENITNYKFLKGIIDFAIPYKFDFVNFFVIDDVITTNTTDFFINNKLKIVKVFTKIITYSQNKHIKIVLPPTTSNPGTCTAPWLFPFISISGDVLPCCALPHFALEAGENRQEIIQNYSFGNIFDQKLKDIWNSQKAIEFRQTFVSKKYNKYCAVCAKHHGLK